MTNAELADQFLTLHDPDKYFRDPSYEGPCELIDSDPDTVDRLADELLDLIANTIASILNAGSERDAVNESEELRLAIKNELLTWTQQG